MSLCREGGARPMVRPAHRCVVCLERRLPPDDRTEESEWRRAMIPDAVLALVPTYRNAVPAEFAPPGQRWCGTCRTFRDLGDFGSRAACKVCEGALNHARRIQSTYGITSDEYRGLKAMQGGRCAICRNRPKTERLAVDHDHRSGAVRGLLCSACNHGVLGSAQDSLAILKAAVRYMEHPPAGGRWSEPTLPTPAMARRMSTGELSEVFAQLEEANRRDPAPF